VCVFFKAIKLVLQLIIVLIDIYGFYSYAISTFASVPLKYATLFFALLFCFLYVCVCVSVLNFFNL